MQHRVVQDENGLAVLDQPFDAGPFLFVRPFLRHRVEDGDIEAVAHRIVDVPRTRKVATVVNTRGREPIVDVEHVGVDAVEAREEVDELYDVVSVPSGEHGN